MLKRVDRILLRVPSLEAAVAYYRDVLGMKLVRDDGRLASFKLGDGLTELVLHSDPDLPDQATYLLVDSVQDLYARREDLKLKFMGPPVPVARGFRATVRDPYGNVLLILDRTADSSGATGVDGATSSRGDASMTTIVEDAKPAGMLFSGLEPRVEPKPEALIELYQRTGRTADDLPYTPHFEAIYSAYAALHGHPQPTRQEVWRHLLNLRKGGKLPKLGPARSAPPEISSDERARLRDLLGDEIGRRDRLPYTEKFDQLVDAFNKPFPRGQKLSPHQIWRLIATLAK